MKKVKKTTSISRKLSHMLRHDPGHYGVEMDKNGWVDTDPILSMFEISFDYLCELVATNNKQRFQMDLSNGRIRASQGHSIQVDLELKEKVPPIELYHGTCMNFTPNIDDFGLKKMNRNHVHLSDNVQTASEVGRRHGESFVYVVEAQKMHIDGFKFYQSNNGVWLTDNVPTEYLRR